MFVADKPYISDFFKETLEKNQYPVADTAVARELLNSSEINFIGTEEIQKHFSENENALLYTNTENAIDWIEKTLAFSDFPRKIQLFKDKAGLRDKLKPMFPNYFYKRVRAEDLDSLSVENLKFPFIIKPVLGFFSLGVRKVETPDEYLQSVKEIKEDMLVAKKLYPEKVIAGAEFVIEEVIEGDEFAIDFYYDKKGKPVILNITKHLFASGKDMSDRAYITSKEIMEEQLEDFENFLTKMGELTNVKNFVAHAEVRKTAKGEVIPIEINPSRFGGLCTTADLAHYSLGINLYEYFYEQKVPDWHKILDGKAGKVFSLIILDNSTGKMAEEIKAFDYEKLLAHFEKPLELRKINYREFPLFGFVFAETKTENFREIEYILKSRLNEFIKS
jgi:carbamoylphosphate synthase large subunit